MLDFINGNKFLEIADFAIDFDHNNINTNIYKKNAIIYCKTDFLNQLFEFIKFSNRKYILISHMSDYPIYEQIFKKAPNCIKKWYAENAIYEHQNLIPIPIGLENHEGKSKGKFTNHEWFINNYKRLKSLEKDSAFYCNWNQNTNKEIRVPIINQLKNNNLEIIAESGLSFEKYCENMAKHQFIICPPGNGADTHRLWESLYLGCYPITLQNRIYENYNLPILQLRKWSDLNLKLVEDHIIKWKDKIDFEQLSMNYWINLIKEHFKNL